MEGKATLRPALIVANVLGWPLIQLSVARFFTRLPDRVFRGHARMETVYDAEMTFYSRVLRIRRWKNALPDGASWVGGAFSKRRLESRDRAYVERFILETRRGEAAHWMMIAFTPVFFLWNPLWACAVMVVYALASNLPCILVQRYNRSVLSRHLDRS